MSLFFFDFRSPWALHGMSSYAIRTRLCSPNTLFRFRSFSEKKLPKEFILESNCDQNWAKKWYFHEKKGFEKWFEKRCPAKCKLAPIRRSGGSRRSSLACALLKQETVVRATIAEKNRTKQKKTETSRRKAKQNINKQKHQQQIRKKQKETRQHTENNCSNCWNNFELLK